MYKNFDLATLEQEYSPSSCVDDINVYLKEYAQLSQRALQYATKHNALERNLPYGSAPDEKLDLFLPIKGNRKKLQVYIHGGYWQALSKEESAFAATNFQQQGCYFAVIDYSLAPNKSLSEIVEQNRKAIVWLYTHAEHLGFDKNQIYLSGSSAGGHLAMMMLQTQWCNYLPEQGSTHAAVGTCEDIIAGICAVSGIYELEPISQTYINDPLKLTAIEIDKQSPIRHGMTTSCPVILAYGETETLEFKDQTSRMKTHLLQAGIAVTFKEIPLRNHFNVIVDLADSTSWLSQQTFKQMQIV